MRIRRKMIDRARASLGCLLLSMLPLLSLPGAGTAHEFWLVPSGYRADAGTPIAVSAFVGTGFRGEVLPYAATRTVRLVLHASNDLDLAPGAVNGDLAFANLKQPDPDGMVLAFVSGFTPIEMAGPEFDRYLALEGLSGPLAERAKRGASAGPGRERFRRCAKTWIAGRDATRVLEPLGLPMEIVPLADPEGADPLEVRVLFGRRPLPGALLRAWRQPLAGDAAPLNPAARDSVGPSVEARTNGKGIATVNLDQAGEWLLSCVHMVPSADREQADWESTWASLTFARRPARP